MADVIMESFACLFILIYSTTNWYAHIRFIAAVYSIGNHCLVIIKRRGPGSWQMNYRLLKN